MTNQLLKSFEEQIMHIHEVSSVLALTGYGVMSQTLEDALKVMHEIQRELLKLSRQVNNTKEQSQTILTEPLGFAEALDLSDEQGNIKVVVSLPLKDIAKALYFEDDLEKIITGESYGLGLENIQYILVGHKDSNCLVEVTAEHIDVRELYRAFSRLTVTELVDMLDELDLYDGTTDPEELQRRVISLLKAELIDLDDVIFA